MRLICFVLAIVAPLIAPPSIAAADEKRPNILFIFSDDHAPHAIGAYGGPLAALDPTPNIDRLAAQGMLFRNSFCTNAICGPSRAVILAGKHSHINGFRHNGDTFNGDQPTFPKMLRAAGYETAVIGKWHLKSKPQGFDFWRVLPDQGVYYNPDFDAADGRSTIEGYCTDIITDLSVEWLEKGRDKSKPFMLMCQHKAPHRNWMPAARHFDLYEDVTIPEPATLFDEFRDNALPARIAEMSLANHMDLMYDLFVPAASPKAPRDVPACDPSGWRNLSKMTPSQRSAWDAAYGPRNAAFEKLGLTGRDLVRWKYQRYMKNYLRCIRALDEGVGRLMTYLEESGLAENTIVIYSSDQGFYLGDHGWFDKRWMYEESLKMPLIVKWPGVTKPGSVRDELVQNLDYASTFLEMAGVKAPADLQGKSLAPLLRGDKAPGWRDAVYYHYYEFPGIHMVAAHCGVRTDRYKLMHFYQFDEWEFYDLRNDPDELKNLYNDQAYQSQIADLKRELSKLQAEYRDTTDMRPKP
ncbi:MAG TPA: sulfatase, partial [Phycisphaerae bacterium]|nr:sulfatase [Phycisphaerae bacterium]